MTAGLLGSRLVFAPSGWMSRGVPAVALAALALAGPPPAVHAQEPPTAPAGALITPAPLTGLSVGIAGEVGQRKLETDAGVTDVDLTRGVVRIGHALGSAANAYVDFGASRLESGDASGDFELSAGAGALVNVLQVSTRHATPVASAWYTATLGLEGGIAQYESSGLDERDLSYLEVHGGPLLTVTRYQRESARWAPYDPRSIAVSGGLVGSWIDGEYGDSDVSADQTVGVLIGAAALFEDFWSADLRVRYFGESDGTLELAIGHRF